MLVGTDEELIFSQATRILSDEALYEEMATARSPYGDGKAAQRIRYLALGLLGLGGLRRKQ